MHQCFGSTFSNTFTSKPYNLDDYQPGCGLRHQRRPYGNSSCEKKYMNCNQFNHINFHRKCSCYLKLNLQGQCQCGMMPSLFHKLVSSPYTSLNKSCSSHLKIKQQKKCKDKCKCKCKKVEHQKQNIVIPQKVTYIPSPQIVTYTQPHFINYPKPQHVSFKTIPNPSVKNFPVQNQMPHATTFISKQNYIRQPSIKQIPPPNIVKLIVEPSNKQIYIPPPKLPSQPVITQVKPVMPVKQQPAVEPFKFPQTTSQTSIIQKPSQKKVNPPPQVIQPTPPPLGALFGLAPQNNNNSFSMFGQKVQVTPQGAEMSMFKQQVNNRTFAQAGQNFQTFNSVSMNSYQQKTSSFTTNQNKESKQVIHQQQYEIQEDDDSDSQQQGEDQVD